MAPALERVSLGGRVLIVRLRSLGDSVLSTPAIALLKEYRPDLEIAVIVERRFAEIFGGNPAVSAVMEPEAGRARRFGAELAINFHGGTRSAWLTLASGARYRAGFRHYRLGWVYNLRIPRAQAILGEERTVHTAEHLASAMFWLGVPRREIPRARLWAEPWPAPAAYAVLHPGASAPEKTWPVERFVALGRLLRERHGLDIVVIGGRGDNLAPFAEFEVWQGRPLREVKRLLCGAALFAGNDSGPAHMAAAFGIPVIVFFGTSDPAVWAPWRTAGAALHAREGLAGISVEQAIEAAGRVRAHAC